MPIIRRRQDVLGPPSTFRRRLLGPGPPRGRGGVDLDCELNVSYGFSFVESGCAVDVGPSYPRVKGRCNNVDGSGQFVLSCNPVLLLSTVSCCGGVLAWLPGDPVLSRQYRS